MTNQACGYYEEIDLDEQQVQQSTAHSGQENGTANNILDVNDDDFDQESQTQQGWLDLLERSKREKTLDYSRRAQHIPKRGEKDYEPDGTDVQQMLLYRSREAMFETIEYSARGTIIKQLTKAYYIPSQHKAVIFHPKGSGFTSIGHSDKHSYLWLNIYEFVYLAERGSIIPFINFSADMTSTHALDELFQKTKKSNEIIEDDELMLSLDQVYQFFESSMELNEFRVYAYLKRLGYIVRRPDDRESTFYNKDLTETKKDMIFAQFTPSLLTRFSSLTGRYFSTSSIYQSLQGKLSYSTKVPKTQQDLLNLHFSPKNLKCPTLQNYKISFDVWKPETNFKKKCPSLPNFQVVIYDKNDKTKTFPQKDDLLDIFSQTDHKFSFFDDVSDWDNLTFIDGISRKEALAKNSKKKKSATVQDSAKDGRPPSLVKESLEYKKMHPMKKLKKGFRSVIIAILDNGVSSFVELSEADFSNENQRAKEEKQS
ncbi:hypothetical protein ACO0QE_002495 [Hanseniaspora vineae]